MRKKKIEKKKMNNDSNENSSDKRDDNKVEPLFIFPEEIKILGVLSKDNLSIVYSGLCRNSKVSLKIIEDDFRYQNDILFEMEQIKRVISFKYHPI